MSLTTTLTQLNLPLPISSEVQIVDAILQSLPDTRIVIHRDDFGSFEDQSAGEFDYKIRSLDLSINPTTIESHSVKREGDRQRVETITDPVENVARLAELGRVTFDSFGNYVLTIIDGSYPTPFTPGTGATPAILGAELAGLEFDGAGSGLMANTNTVEINDDFGNSVGSFVASQGDDLATVQAGFVSVIGSVTLQWNSPLGVLELVAPNTNTQGYEIQFDSTTSATIGQLTAANPGTGAVYANGIYLDQIGRSLSLVDLTGIQATAPFANDDNVVAGISRTVDVGSFFE